MGSNLKMTARTGLALLLLTATGYAANIQKYDTIVIGLGSAGTTAASTLARASKKVLALEAQNRVGGRVNTVSFGNGVVEVGGEWIHGMDQSRVYDLGVENNISMISQDFFILPFWSDKSVRDKDLIIEFFETIYKEFKKIAVGEARPLSIVLTELSNNYFKETNRNISDGNARALMKFLQLEINSNEAANNWDDLSSFKTYEQINSNLYMSWHRHGYKTFFELLLNKYKDGPGLPTLDIKLNTEVTTVTWSDDPEKKVSVTCKDGTVYTADNVIVTVSLGVLKERYGTLFSPSLPEDKITAINAISMGLLDKIILGFSHTWWDSDKNASYGFLWKEEDIEKIPNDEKWLTQIPSITCPMGNDNSLTLWISGEAAKHMETLSEEIVKEKSMKLLNRFMGPYFVEPIPEPTRFIRSTWYSNPYTRGSYTYDGYQQMLKYPNARSTLTKPLTDSEGTLRVLFAGEATNDEHRSTVHGAAETGYREVMRILNVAN